MTRTPPKRLSSMRQKPGSYSTSTSRSGGIRVSISDWVTGPVPGPSSTTRPCNGEPIAAAIARASARPDGATAPVNRGAATRVLRKRALSASPGRRAPPGVWACIAAPVMSSDQARAYNEQKHLCKGEWAGFDVYETYSQCLPPSGGHMSRVTKSPVIDADRIEREIVARLRAAKLRLRFDKVAL